MREFDINTKILGPIRICVIFSRDGVWEGHEDLQRFLGESAQAFTEVDEGVYNHAKAGYTDPLVKALNVKPQVALNRLDDPVTSCHFRGGCLEQSGICYAGSGMTPSCFMAGGPTDEMREPLHRLVHGMLQGTYVVIVTRIV